MEVEVEYKGTETERKLAELEQKAERQTIEIDDEILRKALKKNLVAVKNGLLLRERYIDTNGNIQYCYHDSSKTWKYSEYGKIAEIVAELVRVREVGEQNEKERQLQKQEQEKRGKELEVKKNEARTILAEEIAALKAKISELDVEVKKYKEAEERRKQQVEEQERQEQIRKIEAKGFKEIEWDSEKYKEVQVYFDNDETLDRIRLIDDDAGAETWKDRDTEETITVYSATGKYFVEG